jgi:hypothetical protein
MTPLVMDRLWTDRPLAPHDEPGVEAVAFGGPRAPRATGPTLDALVSGVWEGLVARGAAACPVCGGEMAARLGPGGWVVEGRCRSCGSVLD